MNDKSSNNTVIIRELELKDKSGLAHLLNNKKILDNLRDRIPYPYRESDAENFIEFVRKDKGEKGFAIEYKGTFCGVAGIILQTDVYKKSAEIGYWIGEPFWGKGIATEAVRLISDYGFNRLNLLRLYASVFEFNRASMKVLEKNAFEKEGIFKKAVFKNGKFWDEHRYFKLNKNSKDI